MGSCLRPYTPVPCEGGVSWGDNETLSCVTRSNSCQRCMMSIGFSDGGCLRCCALRHQSDEDCGTDSGSFTSFTAWSVTVLGAAAVCIIFTIVYVVTSKRREGMSFRAFTSQTYFVDLPVAKRDIGESEAAGGEGSSDEETALADSVFLVQKAASDEGPVPVAQRTVPPVLAVRRPQTLAQAQSNIFYLDTSQASEQHPTGGGR